MLQLATGFLWTGLGLLLYQFVPDSFSKKLGRTVYWVGIPLQVLALAHSSDFAQAPWLPPLTVLAVLVLGLLASTMCLRGLKQARSSSLQSKKLRIILSKTTQSLLTARVPKILLSAQFIDVLSRSWPKYRPSRGSFVLSSMLGNTIFIGLSIIPSLIHSNYLGWIILYGVGHSLLGSYGVGVILASHFGETQSQNSWTKHVRTVLTVPALWGFTIGLLSQNQDFPDALDWLLQIARSAVTPAVFILLGVQLGKFRVQNLQTALIPTTIKMCVLPVVAGLGLTLLGLQGDARLSLVLMTGMPTSSSNLILAEEFNLDSQLATGCILLSTLSLPLLLPLWVTLFH